jgi:hypothetical protein
MGNEQPNYKMHKNELRQKKDHPKDSLDEYYGRLNYIQFTMKGEVTKEK